MFENKVRVKPAICPICNESINAASSIDGEKIYPKSGDISICYNCATILEYDDKFQLQVFDIERLFEEFSDNERINIIREQKRIANRNKTTGDNDIDDILSYINQYI